MLSCYSYIKQGKQNNKEKKMIIYTSIHNHKRAEKQQEMRRSNAAGVHTCTVSRSAAAHSDIYDNLESFGLSSADDALNLENW